MSLDFSTAAQYGIAGLAIIALSWSLVEIVRLKRSEPREKKEDEAATKIVEANTAAIRELTAFLREERAIERERSASQQKQLDRMEQKIGENHELLTRMDTRDQTKK